MSIHQRQFYTIYATGSDQTMDYRRNYLRSDQNFWIKSSKGQLCDHRSPMIGLIICTVYTDLPLATVAKLRLRQEVLSGAQLRIRSGSLTKYDVQVTGSI